MSVLEIRAAEPTTIKLTDLTLDTELLLRPLDEATAQEYAEALKAKRELPPIVVYRIGDQLLVCDGQHRYRAHQLAKRDRIACEVREGTRSDCLLASAAANSDHGKPRTTDDKRRAVLAVAALSMEAFTSARSIAEQCNVSITFASAVLKTVHGGQLPPSKGKDGKIRKAPKKAKRKPFDAAKQIKVLTRTIDKLAKKWPTDVPTGALVELLFSRATDLEKRAQPAAE